MPAFVKIQRKLGTLTGVCTDCDQVVVIKRHQYNTRPIWQVLLQSLAKNFKWSWAMGQKRLFHKVLKFPNSVDYSILCACCVFHASPPSLVLINDGIWPGGIHGCLATNMRPMGGPIKVCYWLVCPASAKHRRKKEKVPEAVWCAKAW